MFDLIISPLFIEAGQEHPEYPGLYAAAAPRKAARLRAQDQLVLYIKTDGQSALTSAQQQEILTKLADTYFTASGPITTGLRAVVNRLNDHLLARNLRSGKDGQVSASLAAGVIHGSTLLLAHAGPIHTFAINKNQLQHFDDTQGLRSLGLAKQTAQRFYQSSLESGDVLIFCAEPPDNWSEKNLLGGSQVSLDNLRRRLSAQAGNDLRAGILKVQTGKGQITWYRQAPAARTGSTPTAEKPLPSVPASSELTLAADKQKLTEAAAGVSALLTHKLTAPPAGPSSLTPDQQSQSLSPQAESLASAVEPIAPRQESGTLSPISPTPHPQSAQVQPAGAPGQSSRPSSVPPARLPASQPPARVKQKPTIKPAARKVPKPSAPNPAVVKIRQATSSVGKALSGTTSTIWRGVRNIKNRLFPRRTEPLINLSPTAMLFIAVCIPLVIVAAGTTVYLNSGRSEQMTVNLYYAQQDTVRAQKLTDPKQQADAWKKVVEDINQAEQFGSSAESVALRKEAQDKLDSLDGILRLDYQPVNQNGLGNDIQITHMVATISDVYLLDSSQGRILRLIRTADGYDLDATFNCGPGKAGTNIIGPLIDLGTLPPNNEFRATIMGIDAGGNLVYCAPNQAGYDSRALPPPDTNWGKIISITTYGDMLYVLDPQVNAVWSYFGSNGLFEQKPRLFFDNQVPKMNDVIDLAVDQEFLYLLHANGEITLCESSGFDFSPTRCADPAPFGDSRAGHDPSPLKFSGARFLQMQSTTPPDPSLFILDDQFKSIYHFSLRRLNFQRQYRSQMNADFPFPNAPATAFVITPNRRILIAFKNQVFFASLP